MSKTFFVIVDEQSGVPVTTMPSHSLCLEIMSKLPYRHGYRIVRVPMKTKKLDWEFVEEITSAEAAHFYETVDVPTTPDEWYPDTITTSQLSAR